MKISSENKKEMRGGETTSENVFAVVLCRVLAILEKSGNGR